MHLIRQGACYFLLPSQIIPHQPNTFIRPPNAPVPTIPNPNVPFTAITISKVIFALVPTTNVAMRVRFAPPSILLQAFYADKYIACGVDARGVGDKVEGRPVGRSPPGCKGTQRGIADRSAAYIALAFTK